MLKQRILTAVFLIPIFVALVLKLPPFVFCVLTAALTLGGAYEWSFLAGLQTKKAHYLYPLFILLMMMGSLFIDIVPILYLAALWWFFAFWLVFLYPKASKWWRENKLMRAAMGVIVLIPCWMAINFIRNSENGVYILLFLFVLIWSADSGAYFAGRRWGKHKLAAAVSPGKTWQGVVGGMIFAQLIALGVLYFGQIPESIWFPAILLTLLTIFVSVVGDLFESMLKRNVGLKDSGRLLPGHGGILDRIDSITAAAPIFALGALLIGKFFH